MLSGQLIVGPLAQLMRETMNDGEEKYTKMLEPLNIVLLCDVHAAGTEVPGRVR